MNTAANMEAVLAELGAREPIFHSPGASRALPYICSPTRFSKTKERRARRTPIWARTPDGWKILLHQGTLTQE